MSKIYVCSDIHGQGVLYRKMLEEIHFSDEDHLYILGDIIDRGSEGIEILQDVMNRKNVTCILGNHEHMMYYFIAKGRMHHWASPNNGGKETYEKFKQLPEDDQEEIIDFIGDMFLQVELECEGKKFLLSHTSFLPNEGTMKWEDVWPEIVNNCVWDSPWRFWEYAPIEEYAKDGREHIIGHYPTAFISRREWDGDYSPEEYKKEDIRTQPSVYLSIQNHVCNIDCGCAAINSGEFLDSSLALCVVNLNEYATEHYDKAFRYIQTEEMRNNK